MGRYSLWLDPLIDVCKYELRYLQLSKEKQNDPIIQKRFKMCNRLPFRVDGKLKNKFSIEEIDSLTAHYVDEASLLIALASLGTQYKKASLNYHLLGTYKTNGQVKAIDLIYNSPVLAKYALLERKRQTKKLSTKTLNDSQELKQFSSHLVAMIENKEIRDLVFDREQHLSSKECKKLRSYLPPTKMIAKQNEEGQFYNTRVDPLYDTLQSYGRTYELYQARKQEENPVSLSNELAQMKESIYRILKTDYKTLRKTVLFVQTIEDIWERKKESLKQEEYQQIEFSTTEKKDLYIRKESPEDYQSEMDANADILQELADERKKEFYQKYYEAEDGDNHGISKIELELGEYEHGENEEQISYEKRNSRPNK